MIDAKMSCKLKKNPEIEIAQLVFLNRAIVVACLDWYLLFAKFPTKNKTTLSTFSPQLRTGYMAHNSNSKA